MSICEHREVRSPHEFGLFVTEHPVLTKANEHLAPVDTRID
jgi:hypothetical protein